MRHLIVIALLCLSGSILADGTQVEVIQIMSRPAATLIDTITPLIGEHSSVSAHHDKLVVKGSRAEIDAIRALLRDLDRPARRLLIEVRQLGSQSLSSKDFGYGVHTDNVRLGTAAPGSDASISFQGLQTRGRDDALQQVQALDGLPATIRVGQSVPVYQAYEYIGRYPVARGYEVDYRDTASGFIALPRVHGDQVTVEIFQQQERPSYDGRFDHQQAATVLRGNLGQWLTLGSIGGTASDSENAIGRSFQTRRAQDRQLELRVLAID
ncbi:MAG: hypothetical protein WBN68_00320 [Sedimenticolaceae bacterium]